MNMTDAYNIAKNFMKKESVMKAAAILLGAAGLYLLIMHWSDSILWVITAVGYFIAAGLLLMKLNKKRKGEFNEN